MDKLAGFQGIMSSFEQAPRDWKNWYMSPAPENEPMPGEAQRNTRTFRVFCYIALHCFA